ncbi:MAG: glycosyltransferase family 4 protein [Syntrophomonadaceae bacterium]
MKIAVDGRALLAERTGIGTYTDAIARGLARLDGNEVGLFSPRPLPASAATDPAVSIHADRGELGMLWLQATLPRRLERWGADVLLSALTIGPLRGDTPFVSVVHDLTPVTHPEWHARRTLVGFAPLWERTVERAARFACVSETTARDLVARYPETASRVRVARNGVDREFFSPAGDADARRRARERWAGGRPFLLYLGTLEPRKNVETLVVACERMWARRSSRPDLVLAGGSGWKSEPLRARIAASAFRDRIHVSGYAPRESARELYRAAEAFAYPSLEEGFGLPLLEAMACGTPSVSSDAAALLEVGGGAALVAPARDADALAAALERALDDEGLRARLRLDGPARAAQFSWAETARRTTAVAAEAARSRP